MSRSTGTNTDNGTGVLGGMFSWGPVRVGAIESYNQDAINIFYTEGKYGVAFTPEVSAALSVQFAAQNSTGTNLLNGGTYWATNDFSVQAPFG
jgi:hypothetical protein